MFSLYRILVYSGLCLLFNVQFIQVSSLFRVLFIPVSS